MWHERNRTALQTFQNTSTFFPLGTKEDGITNTVRYYIHVPMWHERKKTELRTYQEATFNFRSSTKQRGRNREISKYCLQILTWHRRKKTESRTIREQASSIGLKRKKEGMNSICRRDVRKFLETRMQRLGSKRWVRPLREDIRRDECKYKMDHKTAAEGLLSGKKRRWNSLGRNLGSTEATKSEQLQRTPRLSLEMRQRRGNDQTSDWHETEERNSPGPVMEMKQRRGTHQDQWVDSTLAIVSVQTSLLRPLFSHPYLPT